jgi:hypothetical protein
MPYWRLCAPAADDVVPASMAQTRLPGMRFLPLEDVVQQSTIAAVYRQAKGRSGEDADRMLANRSTNRD